MSYYNAHNLPLDGGIYIKWYFAQNIIPRLWPILLFCLFVILLFSIRQHKDEVSGDILDMLLTFTDFMAFKEMFIDYRAVSKKSVFFILQNIGFIM